MKKMRIGLYDPYLDTLGGGEKHILSILQAVSETTSAEITMYWKQDIRQEVQDRLHLQFPVPLRFDTSLFHSHQSALTRFQNLKALDALFYVTDGSYFFSGSKRTFIFCMYPDRALFTQSFVNRIKLLRATFITNSEFTKKILASWGIKTTVIYPYVDPIFTETNSKLKQKIILSVGRFYEHLHTKRHDLLIESFKTLKQNNEFFKDYSLIIAGGLKEEDRPYFHKLEELAGNDPTIQLETNISFDRLKQLYQDAEVYWHFAGYGIDVAKTPQLVEHLGMTPLEAMANGCVTFCYNAGGPQEYLKTGVNGFLFSSTEELLEQMNTIKDDNKINQLKDAAKQTIHHTFSVEMFKQRVDEVITKTL